MEVSRRKLLQGVVLIAGAGLVRPGLAQTPAAPGETPFEVEKSLKVKLTDDARKLLKGALDGNQQATAARLKYPLPENSEPCFAYIPTPHKPVKK